MIVRPATLADAARIAHVHVETWRTAYRGQISDVILDALSVERRTTFWRERLAQAKGWVFVSEADGEVTGFCDLIPSRDQDAEPQTVAETVAIYVLAGHWRRGTGRALFAAMLVEARRNRFAALTLWVLASNEAAKHFYEAMGFRP